MSSPRDGQQACSHPAPVARQLWMMLSVKWTFLGASLRRTDENSHDPCFVPSAPLPKTVVSLGAFRANVVVYQPLGRYCPVAVNAWWIGGVSVPFSWCLQFDSTPAGMEDLAAERSLSFPHAVLLSVQQLRAAQPGQRPVAPH